MAERECVKWKFILNYFFLSTSLCFLFGSSSSCLSSLPRVVLGSEAIKMNNSSSLPWEACALGNVLDVYSLIQHGNRVACAMSRSAEWWILLYRWREGQGRFQRGGDIWAVSGNRRRNLWNRGHCWCPGQKGHRGVEICGGLRETSWGQGQRKKMRVDVKNVGLWETESPWMPH